MMIEGKDVRADRPALRRFLGGLLVVAVASVLTAQVVLLHVQSRVLARQEQVLRDREAKVDQVTALAGQIVANLDRLIEAHQEMTAPVQKVAGGEPPIVILPLNQ